MATLQKIRSKGPLLVGVIALALFAFVAGDAFKVFQPQQPHDVGSVDGFPLSIAEYQRMVDEFSEIQKNMYGLNTLSEEQLNAVKDNVWNTYVDNKLVENEAEKLGLTVTKQEVSRVLEEGTNPILRMFPMFFNQETNRFDKDKLFQFLAQYAQVSKMPGVDPQYLASIRQVHSFWAFAEKSIIQNILATKYLGLISPAIITNKVEAEQNFKNRTNQANLSLAVFPYAEADNVEVTAEELKKEYEAQKDKFVQKNEARVVNYIDVKINPSLTDVDSLEKEVGEYAEMLKTSDADYNTIVNNISNSEVRYSGSYFTEKVYPQDIIAYIKNSKVQVGEVFGPITSSQDATINTFKVVDKKTLPNSYQFRVLVLQGLSPEALVAKTDSINSVLKSGADFSKIAESEGQPTEAQWISEENLNSNYQLAELYATLGSMNKGEVKTINTTSGNVFVQYVDSKDPVEKYNLAIVKRRIEISDETTDLAYNKFSQFVAENGTAEGINEKAEEAGYQINSAELYTTMHGVANIPSTKDALKWAFDAETGQISNIYECGMENDHLLVVALTDVVKEGYRPLSLVQGALKTKVLNDKKAEIISKKITEANATSVDALASLDNSHIASVKYVTFDKNAYINEVNGNESVISGYAALDKEGELSSPIKGDYAVYVASIVEKSKTEENFDLEKEVKTIEGANAYLVNYNTILQDLVDRAEIVDVRYKFF